MSDAAQRLIEHALASRSETLSTAAQQACRTFLHDTVFVGAELPATPPRFRWSAHKAEQDALSNCASAARLCVADQRLRAWAIAAPTCWSRRRAAS